MKSGLYDANPADASSDGCLDDSTTSAESSTDEPTTGTAVSGDSKLPLGRGIALGLLATASGLAVAELFVGLIRGSSSPVVPVGQEFIDVTPTWLKDWAIEQFGTNDKAVLVSGALIVVLGLGAIIGMLAVRGERVFAFALTIAIGVMGAWAVWLRPEPSIGKFVPTIAGTVVSLAVLWWLAPRPDVQDDAGTRTATPDRRQFVTGAVAIGSAAAVTGGVGRLLQQRFEVDRDFVLPGQDASADEGVGVPVAAPEIEIDRAPALDGADLGVEGIESFVVPNDDFYRIDTALVVPQVARDSWRLNISGLVDDEIELTFDDLLARDQVERYITLSCVSNPVGGDLVGNALWQGVLLAPILEEAGLQTGAEQLVSRSVDGWTCGSPIEAIMDGRDAMLAFGMNGEPLPAEHGFPVRIVVPGLFGYVSATKWVTDIRLTRWEDFDAYWVPRGWSKRGPVKTMARIDTPRGGRSVSGVVPVGGVAWAVHRGVSAVEVRVDGGEWTAARTGSVPSADTWVQWVFDFDTSSVESGRHALEVRAIDGEGEPQPMEPQPVAPNGAQGYHRLVLDVE